MRLLLLWSERGCCDHAKSKSTDKATGLLVELMLVVWSLKSYSIGIGGLRPLATRPPP